LNARQDSCLDFLEWGHFSPASEQIQVPRQSRAFAEQQQACSFEQDETVRKGLEERNCGLFDEDNLEFGELDFDIQDGLVTQRAGG